MKFYEVPFLETLFFEDTNVPLEYDNSYFDNRYYEEPKKVLCEEHSVSLHYKEEPFLIHYENNIFSPVYKEESFPLEYNERKPLEYIGGSSNKNSSLIKDSPYLIKYCKVMDKMDYYYEYTGKVPNATTKQIVKDITRSVASRTSEAEKALTGDLELVKSQPLKKKRRSSIEDVVAAAAAAATFSTISGELELVKPESVGGATSALTTSVGGATSVVTETTTAPESEPTLSSSKLLKQIILSTQNQSEKMKSAWRVESLPSGNVISKDTSQTSQISNGSQNGWLKKTLKKRTKYLGNKTSQSSNKLKQTIGRLTHKQRSK